MKKFGLIGFPLEHSFSKAYFSEKFEKENIKDYSYSNFQLASIQDFTSLLEDQLANARTAAINLALKQMEVVRKQLDTGERLHATLITNSKRVADMLRQMTEGYDNDPRLLEIAKQIEENICNKTIDQVKNSWTVRNTGFEVADKATDALRQIAAAPAAADMSVSGDVADSGMLADLIG